MSRDDGSKYYKTAMVVNQIGNIPPGEYVSIVKYHEENDTFTIRGQSKKRPVYHPDTDTWTVEEVPGELQCMVDRKNLTAFCL